MKHFMIKYKTQNLLFCGLLSCSALSYAECSVSSNANVTLTAIPSIELSSSGQGRTQFNSGLSCSGLGLVNTTYVRYAVNQRPLTLVKAATNEKINISFQDFNGEPITVGNAVDLTRTSFFNFFTGPSSSIPFYATIPAGQLVSPGTYIAESPFRVKWYYSVPGLAAIGIGIFYESPGFQRGGFFTNFNWGTGVDSNVTLQLTVLADCRISTNNVNFGTAAFAGAFQPVQTSMGIRCSAKTPYTVGLNNGLYPQAANQRAMKHNSTNNYLSYEIYKNSSTQRWGTGNESWSSATATNNAGNYDGVTQQSYSFNTRILPTNSDALPAGRYSDTITVQVEF